MVIKEILFGKTQTHAQKKAARRKLNRHLFETFVLWLENFIGDVLGIAPKLAVAGSGNNNASAHVSESLATWKKKHMQMFSNARGRGRNKWRTSRKR